MYRPRRFVILKHLKKQAAKNGLLFSLVVLGVDVVGKCLDVLLSVVIVAVVVVVLLANKLHLENAAALGAALDGALLVHAEPKDLVRVLGETSASNKLLLTGGADHNGLLNGALVRGVQGLHVENVDALHLTENLETLETSRLLKIRRDGTSLGTGADEVVNGLDIGESLDLGSRCLRFAFVGAASNRGHKASAHNARDGGATRDTKGSS